MESGWESYTWDTEKGNITGVPVLNDCVYNRVSSQCMRDETK